ISNLSGASGTNSKMDDIQASVLLGKLPRLDAAIARRAELATEYTELLRNVPGVLRLPTVVERGVTAEPVYYVYVIEVERRDALVEPLPRAGMGPEVSSPPPLHLQPSSAGHGHGRGDFPNAEAACERTVALPFPPALSLEDVHRVCEVIRHFYTGD